MSEDTPLLARISELESLEAEYEFAREYIKSEQCRKERERIRLRIEKLILGYNSNNNNSDFIIGQCYSMVKELNRFDEVIRLYESKKKSLEELKKQRTPRQ